MLKVKNETKWDVGLHFSAAEGRNLSNRTTCWPLSIFPQIWSDQSVWGEVRRKTFCFISTTGEDGASRWSETRLQISSTMLRTLCWACFDTKRKLWSTSDRFHNYFYRSLIRTTLICASSSRRTTGGLTLHNLPPPPPPPWSCCCWWRRRASEHQLQVIAHKHVLLIRKTDASLLVLQLGYLWMKLFLTALFCGEPTRSCFFLKMCRYFLRNRTLESLEPGSVFHT